VIGIVYLLILYLWRLSLYLLTYHSHSSKQLYFNRHSLSKIN
jgi:hypothetical protein